VLRNNLTRRKPGSLNICMKLFGLRNPTVGIKVILTTQ
jgi:hypothetical protein